jgi:hypothetical protein
MLFVLSVVVPSREQSSPGKKGSRVDAKSPHLPDADPGKEVTYRWRKKATATRRRMPSRGGYHNKQWAQLMERIGLMPSDTGAPGGKRTGQRMHHYVLDGGPFENASAARAFVVPYFDRVGETNITRAKRKVAYTCPSCEDKVWGKPDVQPHCGKCGFAAMVASYETNSMADLAA